MKILPKPLTDPELAFGPRDINSYLPKYETIPPEALRTKWNRVFNVWFFNGLPKGSGIAVKEGIDGNLAMRHLRACMGSFEPKHEHKEAGCAYLMHEWFDAIVNAKGEDITETL